MAKQAEAACEALCGVYAAPHPHAQEFNIPQHEGCGKKGLLHMETGVEENAESKRQLASQWILWQFRNIHIPIKGERILVYESINQTHN